MILSQKECHTGCGCTATALVKREGRTNHHSGATSRTAAAAPVTEGGLDQSVISVRRASQSPIFELGGRWRGRVRKGLNHREMGYFGGREHCCPGSTAPQFF